MTSELSNMNDIVRRRRSKWDMKSEPHEVVELSDDDDLPVKGGGLLKDKDLNSVSNQELQSPKAFDVEPGDKDCSSESYVDKEIGNQASKKDIDGHRETDGWDTALDNQVTLKETDGHRGTDGWGTALDNQVTLKDTDGQGGTDGLGTALDNQATMKDTDGQGETDGRGAALDNQATMNDADDRRETDGRSTALDKTYSSIMSPGLETQRQHNHSRSPTRNCSRSPSSRDRNYRNRSRSRSRSPYYYKDRSESQADRGRFLHEDGGRRHFDRNYDSDLRERRPERPKYPMYEGSQTEFSDLRELNDYSKGKLSQYRGGHYNDGGREKPGLARANNRTTERCYDFTKGRCRRGALCRYIHHETNSRGERSMKESAKERTHDRNYPDVHFGRRAETRRVSEPCKFFAQGRCRNGDKCRFSHEILSQNPTGSVGSNGTWGYNHNLNPGQCTMFMEASSSSLQIHGTDGVPHIQNPQDIEGSTLSHTIFPKALASGGQSTTMVISGQHQPVVNSTGNLPTALNFGQMNQSPHVLTQSNNTQNFPPHSTALPLNGQMQQIIHPVHPVGHDQLIAHHGTPNTQKVALSLQAQPILPHVELSQQGYSLGGHILPSLSPPLEKGQGQHGLGGQVIQHVPQDAHNQQSVDLRRQIQQSITPMEGQSEQNSNITSQIQQSLPLLQNAQSRQNVMPLAQSGQNQFEASQTPNFQSLSSADRSNQASDNLEMKSGVASLGAPITHKIVTSEQAARITDISASLAQYFENAALNAAPIGVQQSQSSLSTDSPVVPVSALAPLVQRRSLAQPHEASKPDSMEPVKPGNSNLASVLPSVSSEQRDPRLREQQRGFKNLVPLSVTDSANSSISTRVVGPEEKLQHESRESKLLEPSEHTAEMEIDAIETTQSKKDQAANPDDGDADVGVDSEGKRNKDDKAIKVFKCALVEFVKELLKPTWREGHLSREAHKTIVKKVVEKVTGAIQPSTIPQTQEKIDLYLSHSKPKLAKLAQAYIGKYAKS